MTRVVLDIGRLVVHGAEAFAQDAFADSLRQEIARRIGPPSTQPSAQTAAAPTVESRAAAAVAAQLFNQGALP